MGLLQPLVETLLLYPLQNMVFLPNQTIIIYNNQNNEKEIYTIG